MSDPIHSLEEDTRWLTDLKLRAHQMRVPMGTMLELTSRCNLKCQHCYLGPQSEQHRKRALEMSTEEVKRVIDQLVAEGCLSLTITGGDPMVRPDFPEIYRYAKERGLLVTVFCDAILVNDRILSLFKEYPPRRVEVSVYGATAETYETVTRVPGSFEKAKRGIERLLEQGINLELKTVLMTLNQDELGDMRRWANDLGVSFRFDAAIFPCLPDNSTEPLDLRVDPERAVAEEMQDPRMRKMWAEKFKLAKTFPETNQLYSCAAGGSAAYIGPQGDLSPCLMTTNYRYSLKDRSLSEVWNVDLDEFRTKTKTKTDGVLSGHLRGLCSHCPAFNFLENGDEECESAYAEKLARLRLTALSEGREKDDDYHENNATK